MLAMSAFLPKLVLLPSVQRVQELPQAQRLAKLTLSCQVLVSNRYCNPAV